MLGHTGSRGGRRLGILRTSRATVKGFRATLCITSRWKTMRGEQAMLTALTKPITPATRLLSVGTSGDKLADSAVAAPIRPAGSLRMTTLYSRMQAK